MAETIRAFVAGHPIGHSRSPLIHSHWLAELGIDGSYEALDIAPADFPPFLAGLTTSGWAGGNVTIPHKEAAFAAVGRHDAAAAAIGAVNTLWCEDGKLVGQISRRDVLKAAHSLLRSSRDRASESTLLYLSALVEKHEAPLA